MSAGLTRHLALAVAVAALPFTPAAVRPDLAELSRYAEEAARRNPKDDLLKDVPWPARWPLTPDDMRRWDEADDADFYASPRFVTHIDEAAIGAIRSHYSQLIPPGSAVLDLCSSWTSHFPLGFSPRLAVGLGMNEDELAANDQLSEYVVQDLNKNPAVPFSAAMFDFVVNVVSVDYLIRPQEVFAEILRVLKPGGVAIMSFSNRLFAGKAVRIWLRASQLQRCQIVSWYFKFAGFEDIRALDITAADGHDPMHVVQARKPQEPGAPRVSARAIEL